MRIRLTTAQALVRAMSAQWTEIDGTRHRVFAGVWGIFGHGNVAALGEALHDARNDLPTWRAHNEQAMAHAAIAYAKAAGRRRMMACTTSIGPGATNLVTAAAVAHVNRLPVLFLPGDVFANRVPDPVLQQLEDFEDGTVSVNDCLRPVSRYFDRITRPEQLVAAFPRAMQVLTDPARCGPVTLALCQDVQAEAREWPAALFEERVWMPRRTPASQDELEQAIRVLRRAKRPLVICGGGVVYAGAADTLGAWCESHGVPWAETHAGKSALPGDHPLNLGAIGVTGTGASNRFAAQADVILAVGTRLQDFTTGSAALLPSAGGRIVALNIHPFDAAKHQALPLVADAREGLQQLGAGLEGWKASAAWTRAARTAASDWRASSGSITRASRNTLPSDAQVVGTVQKVGRPDDIVVCAAGGLPGELHKHWVARARYGYHVEYGFSCMGYEIAGGLGVKFAHPGREVVVMVGDGSYLMMNSELETSVRLRRKLIVVVLDNGGFGCIDRLQRATGNASFNNLLEARGPRVDFVAHARSLGALATKVSGCSELGAAFEDARAAEHTSVIVIDTDPAVATEEGGCWWDVPIPEVSTRRTVRSARRQYVRARAGVRPQETSS